MLFAKIKHQMSLNDFRKVFPDAVVTQPEKKDYAESMWETMKGKNFATLHEKATGREVLYQLTFDNDALSFLQLNLNGDFIESEYLDLTAIALSLIEAQPSRGIDAAAVESTLMPWKDLIQSPLPESGRPDERYIEAFSVSWPQLGWNISLSYTWTWPGQLTLEYREEKD